MGHVRSVAVLFSASLAVAVALAQDDGGLPPEPPYETHVVTAEEIAEAKVARRSVLRFLFKKRAGLVARFTRIDPRFIKVGSELRVPTLPEGVKEYVPMPQRYPRADGVPKAIVILLDRQFLGAYENGRIVASHPISTGRPGYETPEGLYKVTKKDEAHKSSVYPEETNGGWPMPFALRFRGSEYWIHEGELKGHADSHGCVRMMPGEAKKLFDWADIGTPVRVFATYPQ